MSSFYNWNFRIILGNGFFSYKFTIYLPGLSIDSASFSSPFKGLVYTVYLQFVNILFLILTRQYGVFYRYTILD